MRKRNSSPIVSEPIGIVISSGAHSEVAPMFAAYVWGPPESGGDLPEPASA